MNIPITALESGFRFAFAALLAFIFYNLFDLKFGFWAVVTVAAVMRPNIYMTNKKGLLRLLGTLIGLVIATISVYILKIFPHLLFLIFFIAMFCSSLLIFYKRQYDYLGIVCGITVIIIITTYTETPALFYNVTIDRSIDVIVGILISWLCAILIFPNTNLTTPLSLIQKPTTNYYIIKDALLMACATTFSIMPWFSLHYDGGFWAPIACLFIVEENLDKTQQKAVARFVAHVVAVSIASCFALITNTPYTIAGALFFGMFIFGYWLKEPILGFDSSIANSMAIAYCIVLLAAPGQMQILDNALARFLNTILGILIGMLVVNFFNPLHKKI